MQETVSGFSNIASLVIGIILLLALALWIASAIWVYWDSRRRLTSPILVTLLVLLVLWPLSLIVWILARPREVRIIRSERRM